MGFTLPTLTVLYYACVCIYGCGDKVLCCMYVCALCIDSSSLSMGIFCVQQPWKLALKLLLQCSHYHIECPVMKHRTRF